jgi:outer membrane protein assembly factor BamB
MARRCSKRSVVSALARAGTVAGALALSLGLTGCDPASVYGPLKEQWTAKTGAVIASKPSAADGGVYIGDWSGYEHAYAAASGAERWTKFLGVTSSSRCQSSIGITSSPWLQGGVGYLGGGDANWDALDLATGDVLWSVPTGDNSETGGHYNYATPLVYDGHAYVGIASFCDDPLVQGELLRVNLATHRIENVWKGVPDGQVGATIWTTPVVDPATGTVFVTTGTRVSATQTYAEAMIAFDATTLAVKSFWSIPVDDPIVDADFGTGPTLFTDSSGRKLVSAVDKNGILYAFLRDDVGAGPVWQRRIAVGGAAPEEGDGSVSTGFFDGRRLFYAGGKTTIAGKDYEGSIRALDPATGDVLWARGLPALVFGELTGTDGMVVVPARNGLYVVDAATGAVLYANDPRAMLYAGATLADGRLFIGDTNGVVHAYTFPAAPGATAVPASARALPSSLSGTGSRRLGTVVVKRPVRVRWAVGGGGFRLRAGGRVVASRRHTARGEQVLPAGVYRDVSIAAGGRWSVRTR